MSATRGLQLVALAFLALSLPALSVWPQATTLVVGKVAAPGADLSGARVQLFRDAECTELAHTSKSIGAEGTYAIEVEAGTYYARLHVDVNGSQTLDEGDLVGLFGVADATAAGAAPQAVTVAAGQFRTDVNIEASAAVQADGSLGALPEVETVWIVGQVIWEGHDLGNAKVQLFRDPACQELAVGAQTITPEGSFAIAVPPGRYYARALADLDGNGKLDQGEGLGYFGVTDMSDQQQRPQPIAASEAEFLVLANIPVCAVLGEGGRLKAVPVAQERLRQSVRGRVSGMVSWPGHETAGAWVVCAADASCQEVLGVSRAGADGGFSMLARVGRAVVVAIADANGSSRLDAGDHVGVAGIADFRDAQASPQQFEVMVGESVRDVEVRISGQLGADGVLGPNLRLETARMPALLSGVVAWPGVEVAAGEVNVFTDPELQQHAAHAPLGNAGQFALALPAGEYYLLGAADRDGDGATSEGDGIGLHGVPDLFSPQPKQPLVVGNGELHGGLTITITARVGGTQGIEPLGEAPGA
ncbi:MAG: hypothetical protein ACE5R4_08290 [Armatimonadota bacterium]